MISAYASSQKANVAILPVLWLYSNLHFILTLLMGLAGLSLYCRALGYLESWPGRSQWVLSASRRWMAYAEKGAPVIDLAVRDWLPKRSLFDVWWFLTCCICSLSGWKYMWSSQWIKSLVIISFWWVVMLSHYDSETIHLQHSNSLVTRPRDVRW